MQLHKLEVIEFELCTCVDNLYSLYCCSTSLMAALRKKNKVLKFKNPNKIYTGVGFFYTQDTLKIHDSELCDKYGNWTVPFPPQVLRLQHHVKT